MKQVIAALHEALEQNEPVALAAVVEVQGASPAQVGFKLLVWLDGRAVGNVGDGKLERQVREEAAASLLEGRSRLLHSTVSEEAPNALGTPCGGDVSLFIEVYQAVPVLLIVGGGHLGQPLAEMARIVGLQVQVVAMQPERATVPEFNPAAITPWTDVVIVTQTHVTDERMLHRVLDTPAAYVGMIGSQRKVRTIFDHLQADGVSESSWPGRTPPSDWTRADAARPRSPWPSWPRSCKCVTEGRAGRGHGVQGWRQTAEVALIRPKSQFLSFLPSTPR